MEDVPAGNGPIGYAAKQDPIDGNWIDLDQPISPKPVLPTYSDDEINALMNRYLCPTMEKHMNLPFRFMARVVSGWVNRHQQVNGSLPNSNSRILCRS